MPSTPSTVVIGAPDRTKPGSVLVCGVSRCDLPNEPPVRLPWTATFTGGRLLDGWLRGPLVDVLARRGVRVPADVVRDIQRAVLDATGGDNLPRVGEVQATAAPDNVLAFPGRSPNNPVEKRFNDAE
jgi:hypothetical protein